MRLLITGASGFIGTNVIEDCLQKNIDLINIDWNPPLNEQHNAYWKECDIMDYDKLSALFKAFQPTHVLHLAARTDTDIYELDGDLNEYIQNTKGTQHVLDCIKNTSSITRAIITSSMFVCESGYMPQHDQDFKPFTLYGVSKKLTEDYTRSADLQCTWTIIRPQTIWGPWSLRYRDVMFKVMQKGLYFHPSKRNVRRAYGYVGNVVWQIEQIFQAPAEKVHQEVFYVGDQPVDLRQWVEEIALELTNKPVRILPTPLVKGIALTGDLLQKGNIRFPITSTRFNSMTQDYLTPINKTYQVLGTPPYTLKSGVKEMISWHDTDAAKVPQLSGRKLIASPVGDAVVV
uniref:NAD(P)-dependent oxidoreductase n=1 Tax=Roseihalotalea indica TaxID=2867963 RepID=A0AA49Q004_9BACT|nr:NAD(P)-dependent oxidoreductase [Tunicatimonas sp. TK19036]